MTFAIQLIIMAVFGVVLGEIIKWFAERRSERHRKSCEARRAVHWPRQSASKRRTLAGHASATHRRLCEHYSKRLDGESRGQGNDGRVEIRRR